MHSAPGGVRYPEANGELHEAAGLRPGRSRSVAEVES